MGYPSKCLPPGLRQKIEDQEAREEKERSRKTVKELKLDLPFPPSVNHYYKRTRNRAKDMVIGKRGLEYRKAIKDRLALLNIRPLAGPLSMKLEINPPDKRRRDIDNILKALLDALEHGNAYENDNQIVKLVMEKSYPVPDGRVVVEVGKA